MIRLAMNDIEKYTCIRFNERKKEKDYVKIISDTGCYSRIGRIGGAQEVSIRKVGCFVRGTIIHELVIKF
jgi:Astacin (Peptidase family M12A)